MGLSKSKTKTTNAPWGPAQPYILENLKQQQDVFNASQPDLMKYAGMQRDTYGRLSPGAEAGIVGAQNLVNRNLSGANLTANPYLDAILGRTREDVMGSVGDIFGSAGRYGSGMHQAIVAKELADAENQARYADYSTERGYQQQAIQDAQALMGGSQSLLNNAAELPWIGVQAANGAVRQASGGYGTSTTKSSPNWGQMLLGAAMGGLNAYATNPSAFSDRRLKSNIQKIGRLRDGLNVYSWTYTWGEKAKGVIADEVKKLRPWALGPKVAGFATVNYGAL